LQWDNTYNRFIFNADLLLDGSIYPDFMQINNADPALRLRNVGYDTARLSFLSSPKEAFLKFDHVAHRFEFDHDLYISGNETIDGDIGVRKITGWDLTTLNLDLGQFKTGYSFLGDGTGYVQVSNSSYLNPANITFEAWIYINSLPNSYNSVVSKEEGNGYTLLVKSNGKLAVYLEGVGYYDGSGTYTLSTGQWYHVAFTWDGSNLIGYVNGNVDKSVGSGGTLVHSTGNLYLGNSFYGGRLFNGRIDEARIYNAGLSASIILTHYNNGKGVYGESTESNLNAGWHLDENTGSSAEDYSGNGNTGTLEASPLWANGLVGYPGLQFLDGSEVAYLVFKHAPEHRFDLDHGIRIGGDVTTSSGNDFRADEANGRGVIVRDKTLGTVYRILVDNGSVVCEAI